MTPNSFFHGEAIQMGRSLVGGKSPDFILVEALKKVVRLGVLKPDCFLERVD